MAHKQCEQTIIEMMKNTKIYKLSETYGRCINVECTNYHIKKKTRCELDVYMYSLLDLKLYISVVTC